MTDLEQSAALSLKKTKPGIDILISWIFLMLASVVIKESLKKLPTLPEGPPAAETSNIESFQRLINKKDQVLDTSAETIPSIQFFFLPLG